jgi:NADH-quinone oxidoreductase subunit M
LEGILLNELSYPVLTVITFLPLAGALMILLLRNTAQIKWLALATTIATFIASLPVYKYFDKTTHLMQFVETHSWIPVWNINYRVGIDGISVLFLFLAGILSILCVTVSWKAIQTKTKEFYISLGNGNSHDGNFCFSECLSFLSILGTHPHTHVSAYWCMGRLQTGICCC